MPERLKRHYFKEEEFLKEFADVVMAAVQLLDGAWSPDYECGDGARRRQHHLLDAGELTWLVFDGAAVYHEAREFSSAQIFLRSSLREVTVRVRRDGESFSAERVVDRVPGDVGS